MNKPIAFNVFILLKIRFLTSTLLFGNIPQAELLPEKIFHELARILKSLDTQAPELAVRQAYIDVAKQGESVAYSKKLPSVTMDLNLMHRQEFREEGSVYQGRPTLLDS